MATCSVCGRETPGGVRYRRTLKCVPCGQLASFSAIMQTRQHAGPVWEKFLASEGAKGYHAHKPYNFGDIVKRATARARAKYQDNQ